MESLSSVASSLNAGLKPAAVPPASANADPAVQQSAVPGEAQLRPIPAARDPAQAGLPGKKAESDPQAVEKAVKDINDFFQNLQQTLEFKIDEDSGRTVVQIKDAKTDQVIRQIPPEYVLRMAEKLGEIKGLLFEEKA
ncbi:hypothetical protein CCR95_08530 [Thiocystis minor]|uniref:flagellar protein FlaG n=1 Tax=Thiocystis minor TaxID=61597 RepID=UPI0019128C56|nr:flagellar protein FlaG [Thiocystis minor]MBK5964129.1 hypothetical protein [Thiocystis minor]